MRSYPWPPLGEVLAGVVDDVVGADRPDQVQVPGAAHAGHVRSEVLRELDGEGAHAARRADDQDLLPWPYPPLVAQALQGGQPGQRHGRRLLEGQVGGFQSQGFFRDGGVLGEAALLDVGEHLITRVEPRHGRAGRLDLACHVAAEQAALRPAHPGLRAHDVRHAPHEVPVARIHRGRADADQHLAVLHDGCIDVLELQRVGWAVLVVGDRLQRLPPSRSGVRRTPAVGVA
jgi:hypothetical protein